MALYGAMGGSLLPCSVHARATRTLLMQQTDKGAGSALFHQLLPRPVRSFIHSFYVCWSFVCMCLCEGVRSPGSTVTDSLSFHVGAGK